MNASDSRPEWRIQVPDIMEKSVTKLKDENVSYMLNHQRG